METKFEAIEPAMPVWELWCAALVARRSERWAKAGAEGINRRQFSAPEGDLDVPSGFAKNGNAHVIWPNN